MKIICHSILNMAFMLAAVGLISACGSADRQELQQWMLEQRSSTRPKIDLVPEPTKFSPEGYTSETIASVDPFSNQKLTQALKSESNQTTSNAALIAPELNRRKEPLELTPLDSVVMVGSLVKVGQPVALVRVDNLIYQVRIGNYLGQNYGRIINMNETSLMLREIVQDSAGEWIERQASLQLIEGTK